MEEKNLAILDLTTLIEAFGAINEDAHSTLRLFLSTISLQFEKIGEFVEKGNLPAAAEIAHSAKGVANMTGALRLGRICSQIDHALRKNDDRMAREKLAQVGPIYREVEAEIQKILDAGFS